MIARNLETRILKLEVSRRRPDELPLVWRSPDGDVRAIAKRSLLRTIAQKLHREGKGSRWYGAVRAFVQLSLTPGYYTGTERTFVPLLGTSAIEVKAEVPRAGGDFWFW
jgi:hypothetical protein